jgi:methyl-accepting chemotaxis protein
VHRRRRTTAVQPDADINKSEPVYSLRQVKHFNIYLLPYNKKGTTMGYNNMGIGKKLALSFGLIVALMLILSSVTLYRMFDVHDAVDQQNQVRIEKLERLYIAREALAQTGLAARNAYIFEDDADARKELDILDQQKAVYLKALNGLTPLFKGDAQFEQARKGLLAMAEELKRPRQYRDSGRLQEYGVFLVKECSPLRRQIVADIDKVIKGVQQEVESGTAQVDSILTQTETVTIGMSILALILAAGIGMLVTRGLLKQLGGEPAEVSTIASRIAEGDLAVEIKLQENDESSVMHAMKTMRDNLVRIVAQVRTGTDAISTASSEIAAGNLDLSSRTEQQASSLEETAASMEELTSTVKQNADNSRQANQLAATASEIAVKGGTVVSEVVHTMEEINSASKKIVDIITVIDGIAFQTNILALNAAVEAARAGEQGRGFAVVASEVRSLAQRSASAAKEIKGLIDNSVEKVDTGTALVAQAGSTMQEIVDSIRRVTDIMGEITSASQEQSQGIEQVNQAITQMDQVTQQNAALVEEAAAASESMQDQAHKLSELVSVFKLNGNHVPTSVSVGGGKKPICGSYRAPR